MEKRKFRLLQSNFASRDLRDKINRIILSTNLLDSLPLSNEIEITIESQVPAGTSLWQAHKIWQEGYFSKVETLNSLPRQPDHATCPKNIVRLSVECIEKKNPGMGSFYGFTGYYLSALVLVSLFSKKIWDARGEHAT